LGTPLYMSPEQGRGEVAPPASDVYSLGATLFHLIAGRPPFEGTTNISVINQHCHDPAPSLRSCRQDVSDVLSQIVDRCLSKTPETRYRSAQHLLPDLEHFLAGRPPSPTCPERR
ncbi:MAG: serine/threonine protein kinase, partial [Planctomyces sp.]